MLRHWAIVLPLSLSLAGCGGATGSVRQGSAPQAWTMPPDISRSDMAAGPDRQTYLAYSSTTGFVRGTREALASVGHPLVEAPGRNRTVEPCRVIVAAEAAKLGARQVEAVSAGPERRDSGGRTVGPVRIRITYDRPGVSEVRLATLTCVLDRRGMIVQASV